MRHDIILAPEAVEDLRRLKAHQRSEVRRDLDQYLRFEPHKPSKSRVKRLRGMDRPQYRLRIGEIRVFYDISDTIVEVLAILPKADAEEWLERYGEAQDEAGTADGGEE